MLLLVIVASLDVFGIDPKGIPQPDGTVVTSGQTILGTYFACAIVIIMPTHVLYRSIVSRQTRHGYLGEQLIFGRIRSSGAVVDIFHAAVAGLKKNEWETQ